MNKKNKISQKPTKGTKKGKSGSQMTDCHAEEKPESPDVVSYELKVTGARADFLAGNAKARQVHIAQVTEFRQRLAEFMEGLKPLLHGVVDKAEGARQIGIVLLEFADSLPGGKLTRDLYEQMKGEFMDARGQTVPFDHLELFMKAAKENRDPIEDLMTAVKYKQLLLLSSGEEEFQLVREAQSAMPPADALHELKRLFNPAAIAETWKKLKASPQYYPGGRLRDDLRQALAEEWRPTFELVEQVKKELGF